MRLCCVALNAAIDKTYLVPGFRAGDAYRLETVVAVAGGKALNVARTARRLGVSGVACTGFVAGRSGEWIRGQLAASGIHDDFVEVPGESREDILIVDPSGGGETRLLEPGVCVDGAAVEALIRRVSELAADSEIVVIAGSLPLGAPAGVYARLVREARQAGPRVFLDADGEALRRAAAEGPDLIKVNLEEFGTLSGTAVRGPEEMLALGREWRGRSDLVVTLGPQGAVWVGPDAALVAKAPPVAAVMTVGCGDAFLGGYAAAILGGAGPREALALGVAAGTANSLSLGPGVVDPEVVERLRSQVSVSAIDGGAGGGHA